MVFLHPHRSHRGCVQSLHPLNIHRVRPISIRYRFFHCRPPLPPATRDVVHVCLMANCSRPTPSSHKVAVSCRVR
ncbi:hypothetical protein HBI23_011610 [Parastagonospora nodorum]|nr:hypothetical protein HBH46_006480 [Parastagonospora nodorum]KAH4859791.1 hypothetical protein HBH75_046790 [Parastagonospora nodorum]KAH5337921.1 hypothetical protein HBI12_016380 [Parastagonospora nodorum]KAH5690699.1 hypothetical protein HBI23_011610 [Parastagonospora nodorum]KAH5783813.1 hypothetical protein HBI16_026380 [Parastagonospora nodorum]